MPQLNRYLSFDGSCAEAMHFYAQALSGKITEMMNHVQSPMGATLPPEHAKRIMHSGWCWMAQRQISWPPTACPDSPMKA